MNAGAAFGGSSTIALTPSVDFGAFPSGFAAAQSIGAYPLALPSRQTRFIGGGQIGFNWQFGPIVAGVEADIQGLPRQDTVSSTLFNPSPPAVNFSAPVVPKARIAMPQAEKAAAAATKVMTPMAKAKAKAAKKLANAKTKTVKPKTKAPTGRAKAKPKAMSKTAQRAKKKQRR